MLPTEPPAHVIKAAMALSISSPCRKSQRGVVIFDPINGRLISGGHNALPRPAVCDGSATCRLNCAKLCEHAEIEALRDLNSDIFTQLEMVHAKTANAMLVPSGGPSCWQCSRSIAREPRLDAVWLYLDTGWRRYTTSEFHTLTLDACGLPATP